jgi:hypothetical protein
MITEDDLRKGLQNFVRQKQPTVLLKVLDVDEQKNTCTLTDDEGVEYYNVRLKATVISDIGATFYPKKGTFAIAVYIENSNDLHLIYANEYSKMKINCEDIIFNGGINKGLVISGKMTDEFNEIINRINSIVNALLTIATGFSATPQLAAAPVTGGALTTAITTNFSSITIPLTTQVSTTFENSKIKH